MRLSKHPLRLLCGAALILSGAANAGIADCLDLAGDDERLACYDRESGRNTRKALAPKPASEPVSSRLSERWELNPEHKTGTFQFRYHQPIYFLVNWSDNINTSPSSPTHSVNLKAAGDEYNELPWMATEVKFQLSFKVKAWENMIGDNGDLWLAYTQRSFWQLFNKDVSAPFRETNYSPELINTWRTDLSAGGVSLKMVNLGLIHQSNGRAGEFSRSWNRVYAQFGVEAGNLAVLVRPWHRLEEEISNDDNPDIEDYMGRGDLTAIYLRGKHQFSLVGRHSLRSGDRSHGSLEFDWGFPIQGNLKGYLQVFTGYGSSLIDYNHKQTTIGAGISLAEWL
ncbi:phospholipase A [Niveibacterium sp. 24ML]|uniref:phospholipase A n=1 Tax=Niveibacterium sp. 24ML TaxID=2985512 RepID=UPI00226F876D|nr:phospholipase A [Niveibacterium sp. 24ML]MCX9158174.1 phospholipase A [Niveibacterium sp. 24ML]